MTANDKALASYALLKVNWNEGRTYLDNFVPFVVEACFLVSEQNTFSVEEAASATANTFGITLPVQVLHTVFKRIARANFGTLRDRCLVLDRSAASKQPRLLASRATFERANADLVIKLRAHALDAYDLTLSDAEAQTSLYRAISDDSLRILRNAVIGTEAGPAKGASTPADIAIASFISLCLSSDVAAAKHIEDLALGSTLASSVYLESVDSQSRRFRDTTIFLDTPIALKALGYEGPRACEMALQVIELAKASGASVAIFEHSVKEAHAVLDSTISSMSWHGRPGRALRPVEIHFRNSGLSAIEVTMLQESMEDDLIGLGIKITEKPGDYDKFGVDEPALEIALQETVGYKRRKTLLNDLDSIAAIVRLRGDKRAANLETAHAILITDNTSLQYAARVFFKGAHSTDIVTTEDALATLLWLKKPTLAPHLPMIRVAADCFSALTPSKGLLHAFISEVDAQLERGAITADNALMLRSAIEADRAVVVETGGNPANVTTETVERVQARVSKIMTAPITEKLEESQNALAAASQEQQQLKQELLRLRALDIGLRARASKQASRVVTRVTFSIGIIIFLALTGVAILDVYPSAIALDTPWNFAAVVAVIIGALALSGLSTAAIRAIPAVERLMEDMRRKVELSRLKSFNIEDYRSS